MGTVSSVPSVLLGDPSENRVWCQPVGRQLRIEEVQTMMECQPDGGK